MTGATGNELSNYLFVGYLASWHFFKQSFVQFQGCRDQRDELELPALVVVKAESVQLVQEDCLVNLDHRDRSAQKETQECAVYRDETVSRE